MQRILDTPSGSGQANPTKKRRNYSNCRLVFNFLKNTNKKNILIIPSWFPSDESPLSGIFIKEQVEVLARTYKDSYNFIVSKWGYNDSEVSFLKPGDALKKIGRFLITPKNRFNQGNGIYYTGSPYLNISSKIPYLGHFDRLVNVHRKNIKRAAKELGSIDLIHAHVSYPAGYLANLLSKELNVPYLITEHMGPFPFERYKKNGQPISEIDMAIKNADKVVAVSTALSDQMEEYGYNETTVIPNMVDEEAFKPEITVKQDASFRFFTLCSLDKAKGIEDLLNAIAIWKPSKKKVHFLIGGDGEDREEFTQLSEKLEVQDLVTWLGSLKRDEVPGYLNACNAFVLPSHLESFGIVFAEAIACGKPVIATKCGGPEMIVNDINGKLVPVMDPDALAEALKWMVENSDSFDFKKIRTDFEKRFSRKAVAKQIDSLYNSILSLKHSSKVEGR